MVFNNEYEVLIEMMEERMNDWKIKSHSGGQNIELMKELRTKDDQPILIFFWNDEYAVVLKQPQNEEKYISLKEWGNSTILDTLLPSKEPLWTYIIENEEGEVGLTLEAKEIFNQEVMDELLEKIKMVKKTKKEWEIGKKNFNRFLEKTLVMQVNTEVGDVLIVNNEKIFRIIQVDFDWEEYRYGLLDVRTNKVVMKCKEIKFKIGTELFGEGEYDIITSILKKETLPLLRNI